jgi:molecular chaperone GrpE
VTDQTASPAVPDIDTTPGNDSDPPRPGNQIVPPAGDGGPGTRTPDQAVADRVAELEADLARLDDHARRALAELENSHKRNARDIETARAEERANVARQFLPVLDHLELALGHAGAAPNAIVQGVKTVLEQAVDVLRRLGFPRIDETGGAFDPSRQEAVSAVDDRTVPPGTVLHVVRPGYGEGGRQLRPASVVVSTRPK